MAAPDVRPLRVLLRTATAKDAQMAMDVLTRAGFASQACVGLRDMVTELGAGAGALLLAEEILGEEEFGDLVRTLTMQPPWSDLPVLILARQGESSRAVVEAMELPANVTVLERPMRVASLISAVRSALRARRRQYELRTVLEGLRESDQRKTEFLATLAHELRNPMAPLSTTLTLLNKLSPDPAEAKPYYELMGRQVDHMVRLVNDLMEVSRVTRAQIDLQLEDLAVESVLRGAVELSRPLMDAAKHRLEMRALDTSLMVKGDRVRLTQIFSNLLNNAAKYTPDGGRIQVSAECIEGNAVVLVQDNGVGIPCDMLDSVFGMFVQVSGTARAAQGGLGIGLTLVRSLVELHGGTVQASSAGPGTGTQIAVTLPLLKSASGAEPVAASSLALRRVNETILIVDDNRDAADSLAALLGLLGARTAVAYDGADALLKASTVRPSIAILDIGMPHMDGCELAQRLKDDPANEGLALVALTGWGQSADRKRINQAGFDRHLLKPVNIADLTKIIEQLAKRAA